MKQAVRAIIKNEADKYYFVIHNYQNPKNFGKWSTLGGRVEPSDSSLESFLQRELSEEIGATDASKIEIIKYLSKINKNKVEHHFFYCECECEGLELSELEIDEVLEVKEFTISEIVELKEKSKLFFGEEADLIATLEKELC